MDMSQYKDEFISEAKDHLAVISESLIALEKDPSNDETINKLFRAFHTLKGNAATMGYIKFSELSHSLEDVLSKIRDKEIQTSPDNVDVIFRGVDLLESGLEEISTDNPENIDAEPLIEELKAACGKKDENFAVRIEEDLKLDEEASRQAEESRSQGMSLFRLILQFTKNNPLRTAKTLVIIRDLGEDCRLISSTPELDQLKQGKFDSEIELVLATAKAREEITAIASKVSGVEKLTVLAEGEKYQHQEPKATKQEAHEVSKQIQSVKVNMKKLDKLMNLVGELLISNIRLQDSGKRKDFSSIKPVLDGIDRLILDLQQEVMEIRMVPIGNIFSRFPRMVRDLARKEEKKVEIEVIGSEIEFDRTVLDEIGDPLVHLLRNAIDHGIEKPEERAKAGKPETGTITLMASREKDKAIIKVTDDGAGIDPKLVRDSLISKGKLTKEQADAMTDQEMVMMVFQPGNSTNKVVTEVSGRGVGMDVVKSKVEELGGKVSLDTEVGKGTTMTIRLPLTLAIVTALLVDVQGETFIIPLNAVDRTVNILRSDIKTALGKNVFVLRGKEIPLFWLGEMFHGKADKGDKCTVVVVNKQDSQVGLVVDRIISQQQILIKGLQDFVKGTRGVSGATILGDGRVAMILDVGTLL